jgi:hypothetical protein
MDIDIILQNISEKVVPPNISLKEILDIPNYHATLKVQIINNKIYTNKAITEERNIQILNQLRETLKYYELPNTIFAYCTQDHTPDKNCFLFSHAIQPNCNSKNIPAPCFTFDEFTPTDAIEKIYYDDAIISLYNHASTYMKSFETWEKKTDTVVFIGTLNADNDRINNTNFGKIEKVEQIIKNNPYPITRENYISREALAQYKYLLHLNGHHGAYSSRLKYLLMTGSLCFYIINHKGHEKPWLEYWMFYEELLNSIIITKTTSDCKTVIEHFNNNKEAAYQIANRAFNIVHQLLSKKNVLLYWKILLNTYSSRFEVKEQYYFVPFL